MDKILLVEGKNDLHVFYNIFKKHAVKEGFKPEGKDGDAIYKSIPIYLKTDITTLGIVIDADDNLGGKWKKLKGILTNSGYVLPDVPNQIGTIITKEESPTIGIWIMPDNDTNGMLEDFVKQLVPIDDSLMPFVEESLDKIESSGVNNYKAIHKSKARIHTWLAWQETPGTPMGLAIKK
ncbi:MAG: hypothetical protein MI922_26005, partial [Bacteroidales bacterium]|nr:hypothetical protein [Bacteroidales bacterium]